MRRAIPAIGLLLLCLPLMAQTSQGVYRTGSVDPSGSCSADGMIYVRISTGVRWVCESGVWEPKVQTFDASSIVSGTVATARLGSGTPDSTKFLRGDQTWDAPTASAAWGSITGTLSAQTDLQTALDGKEASGTFSGVGACAANTWSSTLNDGSAPTCTQPGFSNLSGAATDAQVPNTITVDLAATATALAANGGNCTGNNFGLGVDASGVAECAQPAFSNLSGAATDAQVPNTITLDNLTQVTARAISDTTGTLAVGRGGTGAAPGADDQVLVADSTSAATWRTVPDCDTAATSKLLYDQTTNAFSCGTDQTAGGGPTVVVLSADRTNATTSYADITDLSFSLAATTRYKIECVFQYNANATTTGIGVGWTGPASPTFTTGQFRANIGTQTQGGTVSAGNDTGSTTTASAATTLNSATFLGVWSNGSNSGTLQMRFKSEVAIANAIIIKAGSMCSATVY